MGTDPISDAYPAPTSSSSTYSQNLWSNWYIIPVLGSCSINMYQNIVTSASYINTPPSEGFTSPTNVLTLYFLENTTYYFGSIPYISLTNINLMLSFGGETSFGGSVQGVPQGGIFNAYFTNTSAYYYDNYSKTLFSDVTSMFSATSTPSNSIYNASGYQNQLINSAYTLAYYIFYLYLYNSEGQVTSGNLPYGAYSPIFQGMDFDLENFYKYSDYFTNNTPTDASYYDYVLYVGIISQTIKYLATTCGGSMIVSHAPQPGYFNVINVSPYTNTLPWGFSPTITNASSITNFTNSYACLYQLIEQYFGTYIDFYNIQFYNQGGDFYGSEFIFGNFFILDYPNQGGFNCSVLQLNQSTYLSNQMLNQLYQHLLLIAQIGLPDILGKSGQIATHPLVFVKFLYKK